MDWRAWLLAGALAAPLAPSAHAQATAATPLDLAQAWRLALDHDPSLRAARAALEARSERLPQADAQLMPNVSASLGWFRNDLESSSSGAGIAVPPPPVDARYGSSAHALTLRQPLYRPVNRADQRQALAEVAQAQAAYEAESQGLAVRVAEAYLKALASEDQLAVVAAQKTAIGAQLDAAGKRLRGGSGTRTDIDEAQARLDLVRARELEASQNAAFARQRLQALVGVAPGALAPLDPQRFAPEPPHPQRVEDWIGRAEQGSPELRALRAKVQAAQHEVEKAQAAHLPTLDAVAQVSRSDADDITRIDTRYRRKSIGVQLNVPIFSGGYASSKVRQALAQAREATDRLEALRGDLGLRVHEAWRGVGEGVLRIRALEQALRSADTSLQSTLRSFEAGARTQVDVLDAQQQRAQALLELGDARRAYVLSRIRLAALGGGADPAAIAQANAWLGPAR